MGLADDIRGFRESWHPNQGPTCRVDTLLSLLSESERREFEALLSGRAYATDIAKMVQGWSDRDDVSQELADVAVAIKDNMIQRHRRGACACED